MPFDALTMAAVADELRATSVGGRIQKILQPSALSIGMELYARGSRHWLVMSADPRYARVHLSSGKLAKGFAAPSPFIMLLRKHLLGGRIVNLEHVARERVLTCRCAGDTGTTSLIVEVMGKHSNIILVGDSGRILGSVKAVSPRESRVRTVLPGILYVPPPEHERDERLYGSGNRVDPYLEPVAFAELLLAAPRHTALQVALLGLLPGSGPFLVEQVAARAGVEKDEALADVDVNTLTGAAAELYALYESGRWAPCTFLNRRERLDFAPYHALAMPDLTPFESISVAIDRSLSSVESRDALSSSRGSLLADLERAQRSVARRINSLRDGLASSAAADEVMQQGQLLLAYQHEVVPGASQLSIPELGVTVPLNSDLSAKENAERLFRRYRKLREARQKIPPLLVEAEAEAERLRDLEVFARLAESEGALQDLRRELGTNRSGALDRARTGGRKARGPMRFSVDGYTALVGRTAQENDQLTFRLARRDDLWLHARQRTGAHVILREPGREPPDELVRRAAELAAHFSDGRLDAQVDVDVTRVRDVRRVPGGTPGRVTYRNYRTVRAHPRVDAWQKQ